MRSETAKPVSVSTAIAIVITIWAGSIGSAAQDQPPKVLLFVSGLDIAKQLSPDDRLAVVYKIRSEPPVGEPLTLKQELDRIAHVVDAIAVIDVEEVDGVPTSARDWATTRVRGKILDLVKTADRASLGDSTGRVSFEFDGGELSIGNTIVRVGDYPPLKRGEHYLIMFKLHPTGLLWYPLQPFRVNGAGVLERVKFVSPTPIAFTSPLEGQRLETIANELRKH